MKQTQQISPVGANTIFVDVWKWGQDVNPNIQRVWLTFGDG